MKKTIVVSLSILSMCCLAIGLTGCSNNGHVHSYDKQVISDEYLTSSTTCTEKARYYYSCECGAKGTETFEYGSTTKHNFVNGSCTYCGKKQEASQCLAFTLLDDETYEVSGKGSYTNTEIVIPSVYNDKPVTSIGNWAFSGCSGLTSVTIPDSVTSIGNSAFEYCRRLTSVTIGNKVTSIGDDAFYGCSGLTSVTIPDSVTSIGNDAFKGCSGLTGVTIGNKVTSIGWGAFSGCRGIESLVVAAGNEKYRDVNNCIIETETKQLIVGCKTSIIPSDGSVTSIGNSAFEYCSGLTNVTIPDSVTSIGKGAFLDCSRLTSITYKGTIADWNNINKGAGWNGNVPTTCVIHCTDGKQGIYE